MKETLEHIIIPLKHITPQIIFWLKPNGENYCKGRLKENETNICLKQQFYSNTKYPLDCKYLIPNYDFPNLTKCIYSKKNG